MNASFDPRLSREQRLALAAIPNAPRRRTWPPMAEQSVRALDAAHWQTHCSRGLSWYVDHRLISKWVGR